MGPGKTFLFLLTSRMAQLDDGPWPLDELFYFSCSELTIVMAQLDDGPGMNSFYFSCSVLNIVIAQLDDGP